MTTAMTKNSKAAAYLKKPYARILTPDPTGVYVAQILEFPGCVAEGDTPQEAYEKLEAAAESWVYAMLDGGQAIPEPTYERIVDFSGKVALRLPRGLHRDAVRHAERERTSLNQFLVSSISASVGAMNFYDVLAKRIERRISQISLMQARVITAVTRTDSESVGTAEYRMISSGITSGEAPDA
jgi:predicted RNase H-like HicB family nuclease